jgi:hypothetical protein
MVKNCASRWSFTKNHDTIHGQQNVKNCVDIHIFIFDTVMIYMIVPANI